VVTVSATVVGGPVLDAWVGLGVRAGVDELVVNRSVVVDFVVSRLCFGGELACVMTPIAKTTQRAASAS